MFPIRFYYNKACNWSIEFLQIVNISKLYRILGSNHRTFYVWSFQMSFPYKFLVLKMRTLLLTKYMWKTITFHCLPSSRCHGPCQWATLRGMAVPGLFGHRMSVKCKRGSVRRPRLSLDIQFCKITLCGKWPSANPIRRLFVYQIPSATARPLSSFLNGGPPIAVHRGHQLLLPGIFLMYSNLKFSAPKPYFGG
jgi:hypothetical protein